MLDSAEFSVLLESRISITSMITWTLDSTSLSRSFYPDEFWIVPSETCVVSLASLEKWRSAATTTLPQLPPFGIDQSLSNYKVLDILLHGTPKSWQVEMDRQGFDPLDKTIPEVVDFMENIEAAKEHSRQSETVAKKKSSSSNNNKKDNNKSNGKWKPTHFCKEHGPNFSYNTENCRTLADKKGDSSKKKKSYPNKTWVRKANEANSTSKKELAAFVQKEVKKGVKKQLAAVSKKRKNDSDSEDESDDKECFLLEELSKGIDGFNYDDMEKLSIHDAKNNDEVSVWMIGEDVSISSDEVDNNSISSDQMITQPKLFALDELRDSSDEDSSCCSTMSLTSSEGEEFDSLDECLEAYSLAEYIRSQHNKNKQQRVDDYVDQDMRP
jgi:hypothetical protein